MKVNEAIIDCLTENDIDTLFGIPGKQSLPLNESIYQRTRRHSVRDGSPRNRGLTPGVGICRDQRRAWPRRWSFRDREI